MLIRETIELLTEVIIDERKPLCNDRVHIHSANITDYKREMQYNQRAFYSTHRSAPLRVRISYIIKFVQDNA
jgi:hypothetical protein